MAETLLQKAQRLGVKPANSPVSVPANTPIKGETLSQKAQRLGMQPAGKEPTFGGTIVRGFLKPFASATTSLVNLAETATGRPITKEFNDPYLGKIKALGSGFDVTKGVKANELPVRDALAKGFQISSNIGGAGVGKTFIKGALKESVKGFVKNVAPKMAKEGFVQGSTMALGDSLERGDTIPETIKNTAVGGTVSAIASPLLGLAGVTGKAGMNKARNLAVNATEDLASGFLNRINRVDPSKFVDYKKTYGEDVGKTLENWGIFGDEQQTVEALSEKFINSRKAVDATLDKIKGNYKPPIVKTVIEDLTDKLKATSAPGTDNSKLARVNELADKFAKEGLEHKEINELKRLYEREVKLSYNLLTDGEKIKRATNIDKALVNWQRESTKGKGFMNIKEMNEQTAKAKFLIDAISDKYTKQQGNNAIGLTDTIILSGLDAKSASAYILKKTFSSKKIQAKLAEALSRISGKVPEGDIAPKTGEYIPNTYQNKVGEVVPLPESQQLPARNPNIDYNINQGRTIPLRAPYSQEAPAQIINRSTLPPNSKLLPAPVSTFPNTPPVQGQPIRLPANINEANLGKQTIRNSEKAIGKPIKPVICRHCLDEATKLNRQKGYPVEKGVYSKGAKSKVEAERQAVEFYKNSRLNTTRLGKNSHAWNTDRKGTVIDGQRSGKIDDAFAYVTEKRIKEILGIK